jgi:phosphohistidine phosphatase
MTLYLIRHATAAAHGLSGGDFARSLVPKGIKQAHRVGTFLRESDLIPDLVFTSPVLRAKETAEILAGEGCPSPIVQSWLSCGMRPEIALQELSAYRELDAVAIVGHEPDFSTFIEYLLGTIRVKKASVISLEIDPPRQAGSLNFSIPCKYLPE